MENQFLNETALKELIQKKAADPSADAQDDLKDIQRIMENCHKYVDTVVKKEAELMIEGSSLQGEEYQEKITQYDKDRHGKHEDAIIGAKVINRIASRCGVDPVFTGDETQRHQVAEFCLELDQYLFRNRRMKLS